MSNSLRIIFAGTPDFAARHLETLIHSSHKIIGVLTQPDRPSGRGYRLTSSVVKKLAQKNNLPIFQPVSLKKTEDQKKIADLDADIIVVVAYGLILPKEVLNIPKLGCINVHGSLLPRWRCSSPIQRTLCSGDTQTGVTIIQMDSGIDTGSILSSVNCKISLDDTSASLCEKLIKIGTKALLSTLEKITSGNYIAIPQDNTLATYAKKLKKREARIDWRLSAIQLERCIRAFNPWPVSNFQVKNHLIQVWGARVSNKKPLFQNVPGKIVEVDKTSIYVATGDGILALTLLKIEGKKMTSVKDLMNARRSWFLPGIILD